MKRWKIVLPTLLATSGLPLVSLVGCGDPVETYTISGGNESLKGQAKKPDGDRDAWQVTNSKGDPVTATLSIEGIEPSTDFPDWIQINDGKVKWTNKAATGTYKFKVKAEIEDVKRPVYSKEITLVIAETYSISGGSKTLNGIASQPNIDDNTWVVEDSKGDPVAATLSINGIQPASDFPDWIQIENGKVKWTVAAAEGIYKFNVKAEIEGSEAIYSEDITLTIGTMPFEWSLNEDGTAILAKYIGEGSQVIIPSSIQEDGKTYSVVSIGNSAFFDCSSLTSVVIPDSITSIGESAFEGCSSLTNSSSPDGSYGFNFAGTIKQWKKVERGMAWYKNTRATIIQCSDDIALLYESIYDWEYNDDDHTATLKGYNGDGGDVIIPSRVWKLEVYNVVSIGNSSFSLSNITSVTIPNSVISIEYNAFAYCSKLKSVTISDSVESIGDCAFYDCNTLTSVIIGKGVTSIGADAFSSCSSLTDNSGPYSSCGFNFSGTVEEWKKIERNFAWHKNTPATMIQCHIDKCDLDKTCFQLSYNTEKRTATLIGYDGDGGDVIIPEMIVWKGSSYFITSIGNNAFVGSAGLRLTSITIPNSVTSIGNGAFQGCINLTSINIPKFVASIGALTFSQCTSLASIVIPNRVESIGNSAFFDCTSLTSITIPNSVTSIGDEAFETCSSLTSVIIGEGVTKIGAKAFYGCSNLTDTSGPDGSYGFNFVGTVEQWKKIQRGTDWHTDTPASEIQCSGGVCNLDAQMITYPYLANKEY